jgi:hypothetical protein
MVDDLEHLHSLAMGARPAAGPTPGAASSKRAAPFF